MPVQAGGAVFLLTDYGYADEFAGVVRAVVVQHAPQAVVVDVSHGVAPDHGPHHARELVAVAVVGEEVDRPPGMWLRPPRLEAAAARGGQPAWVYRSAR